MRENSSFRVAFYEPDRFGKAIAFRAIELCAP